MNTSERVARILGTYQEPCVIKAADPNALVVRPGALYFVDDVILPGLYPLYQTNPDELDEMEGWLREHATSIRFDSIQLHGSSMKWDASAFANEGEVMSLIEVQGESLNDAMANLVIAIGENMR